MENAAEVIEGEFHAVVEQILRLHSDLDLRVEPVDWSAGSAKLGADSDAEVLCSSISLEGEDMSCSLALFGRAALIQGLSKTGATCAADWIGELANLLMGALKNRLSEYGLCTRLGLPVCVQGKKLEFISRHSAQSAVAVYTDIGSVAVELHYSVDPNTQWQRDPDLAAVEEGGMCLF
jgi:CheY-specific phosphatase CheX